MTQYTQRKNRLTGSMSKALHDVVKKSIDTVFPAMSLSVFQHGDEVFDAAWGWIDPETRQHPVTPDSLFDMASVTKLYTETAFLAQVSAGTVALETVLVDVLPEFGATGPRPIDGGFDPHTKQPLPFDSTERVVDPADVTMRHLVQHLSGMAPWRPVFVAAAPAVPVPPDEVDPVSRHERWANGIAAVMTYPFVDQPGKAVRYSDLGLMLLAESIIRLTNQPLDDAINTAICAPLGLDSLIFNPVQNGISRQDIVPTEHDADWRKRRCWGEVHDENAAGLGGVSGHAGLFGTAQDIARFGQAWLERDQRLGIDRQLMDAATTYKVGGGEVFRLGYGFMLRALHDSSAGDIFSVNSFGHTGFTGTSLWIDPDAQIVVACLTNRVYFGRDPEGIHAFRRELHDLLALGLAV